MPALITAPGAPAAEDEPAEEEDEEDELPHAARRRGGDADHGGPADEVTTRQPPRGELVDNVVRDLALVLAQAPEPTVIDIACHYVPP
jgi:hypothetical protein